ncbi:RipA family octameric membrane protein [Streptomyces sp. XH2]|uniref:RipA family octameric membrane protein n=1 Tax=Streptomyces sp. XH2 TaxID=3412483 RepID=UPI003C7AD05E
MTGIDDTLWNAGVGPTDYARAKDKYQGAILEQYKLCVEMADRVSARRSLTNTFFLSLNTVAVTALVTLSGAHWRSSSVWLLLAGLAVLLTQCLGWFVMMRSYRQLNAAKYAVIGALERRLPALAYSDAEWGALGEGHDWRRYVPLTYVEQGVPVVFGVAYVAGFLATTL